MLALKSLGDGLNTAGIQQGGVWWLSDRGENDMKPPPCQKLVDELVAANVPDTATFQLQRDAEKLKAGTHTFAEAKASCTQIAYVSKVKAFTDEVFRAINFRELEFAKRCVDRYDEIIKAGLGRGERRPRRRSQLDRERQDQVLRSALHEGLR